MENNKQDSLNGHKEKNKKNMKSLIKTEDYDSLASAEGLRVVYDKTTDLVWIDTPIQSLYEFVDLGLSVKWASCNVGAEKPEDFGLYFAWGETQGYSGINDTKKFVWSDYELCGGSDLTLTKYNNNSVYGTVDNLTVLEQVDDAAYTSDKTCRMPTRAEFEELTANTTSVWETLNGVNGRRFTSKTNGNSIFVPAAGICYSGSAHNVGSDGRLWSSSLNEYNSRDAWDLYFDSGNVSMYINRRYYGLTVRAVKK